MIIVVGGKFNEEEEFIIPNESIRVRIIANSNSIDDQYMKGLVKDYIEGEFASLITLDDSIESSRKKIINNIDNFNDDISDIFEEKKYQQDFNIHYGRNYFPKKEYKGVTYSEGNYESLVVEIGAAEGDNWWCVLFPPLCLLEAEENEDVEYRFLVKDVLDKLFNH